MFAEKFSGKILIEISMKEGAMTDVGGCGFLHYFFCTVDGIDFKKVLGLLKMQKKFKVK